MNQNLRILLLSVFISNGMFGMDTELQNLNSIAEIAAKQERQIDPRDRLAIYKFIEKNRTEEGSRCPFCVGLFKSFLNPYTGELHLHNIERHFDRRHTLKQKKQERYEFDEKNTLSYNPKKRKIGACATYDIQTITTPRLIKRFYCIKCHGEAFRKDGEISLACNDHRRSKPVKISKIPELSDNRRDMYIKQAHEHRMEKLKKGKGLAEGKFGI